jgi:hypothetical protein
LPDFAYPHGCLYIGQLVLIGNIEREKGKSGKFRHGCKTRKIEYYIQARTYNMTEVFRCTNCEIATRLDKPVKSRIFQHRGTEAWRKMRKEDDFSFKKNAVFLCGRSVFVLKKILTGLSDCITRIKNLNFLRKPLLTNARESGII